MLVSVSKKDVLAHQDAIMGLVKADCLEKGKNHNFPCRGTRNSDASMKTIKCGEKNRNAKKHILLCGECNGFFVQAKDSKAASAKPVQATQTAEAQLSDVQAVEAEQSQEAQAVEAEPSQEAQEAQEAQAVEAEPLPEAAERQPLQGSQAAEAQVIEIEQDESIAQGSVCSRLCNWASKNKHTIALSTTMGVIALGGFAGETYVGELIARAIANKGADPIIWWKLSK